MTTLKEFNLTADERRLLRDAINTQIRQLGRFIKNNHGLGGVAEEVIADLNFLHTKLEEDK